MAKDTRKALTAPLPEMTGDYARDIPILIIEITDLRVRLYASRLRAANLEAAILAALRASEDGDIDPLEFLRDELPETGGRDYA